MNFTPELWMLFSRVSTKRVVYFCLHTQQRGSGLIDSNLSWRCTISAKCIFCSNLTCICFIHLFCLRICGMEMVKGKKTKIFVIVLLHVWWNNTVHLGETLNRSKILCWIEVTSSIQYDADFQKHSENHKCILKCHWFLFLLLFLWLPPLSRQRFPWLHQPVWCSERLAAGQGA